MFMQFPCVEHKVNPLCSQKATPSALVLNKRLPQVINEQILGRLDGALNSAGGALKSAGNDLLKAKETAQADQAKARADLEKAKTDVANALKAFDDAKAKVRCLPMPPNWQPGTVA